MAEDLNKADVKELPDLGTLTPGTPATETGTPPANPPEPGATQTQESSPEGDAGRAGEQEGAQPSTDGEQASAKLEGEEGTTPPAGEEGGKPPEGTEGEHAKAPESTPEQQNALLSEMTEGRVDTAEDMVAVLDHYEETLDFVEKIKKEPLAIFPEDSRERKIAEFLMKQPGDNFQGDIQKFHHVQGLGDPKDLSPEQAQFEAYMLKEENADLTREQGRKYFDAEYEEKYGEDLEALKEDDPLKYRKHEVETNQARKLISDTQTEFQSETTANTFGKGEQPQYSPEEYKEFTDQVDASLDDYGGLSIAFDSDTKPEDRVNFVLDEPADRRQFEDYLKDPGSWWDDLLGKHMDKEGNFDQDGYRDDLLIRIFPEKAMEVMFKQGYTKGQIDNEKGIKNTSDAGEAGGTPAAAEEKSFVDEWADALGM